MIYSRVLIKFVLALILVQSAAAVLAHGPGQGASYDGFIVTRHFTGIWDQVDQEAQGIALQVVEQSDNSRKSVAYWYTYGADRKTAWYMAIGDLIENRIEAELYESADVGFMQDALPGNDSVQSIGTMTIVFDSCESGVVTYATTHQEVGSGSFKIKRLLEVMNTHCSGGISDDMHADSMFGEQRIELMPTHEGVTGSGRSFYSDYPAHMEFEVEVDDLPDGGYHLYVGMQNRGDFTVQNGHGGMQFASPGETGKMLLTFDPRGKQIDIQDNQGVVLSSFDGTFYEDDHGHNGYGDGHNGQGDHNFDCAMGRGPGHGMGTGMGHCVNEGEFVEIEIDLENTGIIPEASGEAEWGMNTNRVEFSVKIEDVAVGFYPLNVGGNQVGIIETFEMHDGGVYGHIKFRDPESYGREHLDFEPRGQKIEVFRGSDIILEVNFPTE